MDIVDKAGFLRRRAYFLDLLRKGAVFAYPTDTIYGIGCSAVDADAVAKVRDLKGRDDAPFSVIAPSAAWIRDNCIVDKNAEEWLKKLPGPYTLVLELKKKGCVAGNVVGKLDSIGVRIPKHWISDVVSELGLPIVTTSLNKSGTPPLKSVSEIDVELRKSILFAIDEGIIKGNPSTLVFPDNKEPRILERK